MRMIFVNLLVKDLPRSKAFFEALGFSINPAFTDENAACVVISEGAVHVMLITESRFRDFIKGDIADPRAGTAVLNCLSCDSRADVEAMKAKALAAGGAEWLPDQDYGGAMYGASFQDPDGHVWELMWVDEAAMAQGAEAA